MTENSLEKRESTLAIWMIASAASQLALSFVPLISGIGAVTIFILNLASLIIAVALFFLFFNLAMERKFFTPWALLLYAGAVVYFAVAQMYLTKLM